MPNRPDPPRLFAGLLRDPAHPKLHRNNWTQKARRNLLATAPPPARRGISFGPTTSSNSTNTTNYTKKHNSNNISQSRQKVSQRKPIQFRTLRNFSPTAQYNKDLRLARINESEVTPPAFQGRFPMSPAMAYKHAQFSAESNTPENIRRRIETNRSLTPTNRVTLRRSHDLEYTEPPAAKTK